MFVIEQCVICTVGECLLESRVSFVQFANFCYRVEYLLYSL